jgi:hypothetical protein
MKKGRWKESMKKKKKIKVAQRKKYNSKKEG